MNKTILRFRLAYEKIRLIAAALRLLKILIELVSLTFNYQIRMSRIVTYMEAQILIETWMLGFCS